MKPKAEKEFDLLPTEIGAEALRFMMGPLRNDPHKVGRKLQPPLAHVWHAWHGQCQFVYQIVEQVPAKVVVTGLKHSAVS